MMKYSTGSKQAQEQKKQGAERINNLPQIELQSVLYAEFSMDTKGVDSLGEGNGCVLCDEVDSP